MSHADDLTGLAVVALAALSLLFGPAWLAVARRLHMPAVQSVRSGLEMFRLLYDANTLGSRTLTRLAARLMRHRTNLEIRVRTDRDA